MRNLIQRAKYSLSGEDGASNVEIIVWISVVLIVATVLWAFSEQITEFIQGAINTIGEFNHDGNHLNP